MSDKNPFAGMKFGRKRANAISKFAAHLREEGNIANQTLGGYASREVKRMRDDTFKQEIWLEVQYDIDGNAIVNLDTD